MTDTTEIIAECEKGAELLGWYSWGGTADAVRAIIAAYREQAAELNAVWAALPGVRYLDPPDGGDVPLADQVRRMAAELAELREYKRKCEEQEPVAWVTEDGERAVTDKTYRAALRDGGASKSAMAPFCVPAYRRSAAQGEQP